MTWELGHRRAMPEAEASSLQLLHHPHALVRGARIQKEKKNYVRRRVDGRMSESFPPVDRLGSNEPSGVVAKKV